LSKAHPVFSFSTEEDVQRSDKIYPASNAVLVWMLARLIAQSLPKLGILAKFEAYDKMAEEYNLMDCFECGSCSYVCPSHIPLVQYFRLSKSIVRKRQAAQNRLQ
jgi:electron transport complex protein RnfC